MNKIKLFIKQVMARYLQKNGWVVFYLEPQSRVCKGVCWLHLYNQEIKSESRECKGDRAITRYLKECGWITSGECDEE